jgi:hypothetical protein
MEGSHYIFSDDDVSVAAILESIQFAGSVWDV